MTDRERFEAWAMSRDYWISTIQDDVGYKSPATRVAFEAWQASRKQALEEALAGIDKEWVSQPSTYDFQRAARDGLKDAAAIVWRLANPEGEQG